MTPTLTPRERDILRRWRQCGDIGRLYFARTVDLWTNPGELVYSPFAGIGSEGYEALRLGRRFVGVELKAEYRDVAVQNLKAMEAQLARPTLFDWAEQRRQVVVEAR